MISESGGAVALAIGLGSLGGLHARRKQGARRATRLHFTAPSRANQAVACRFTGPQPGSSLRRSTSCRAFVRFSEDAIAAIHVAQEEARRQGYGVVCTELLLYGMLAEEHEGALERVAKAALARAGMMTEVVRQEVSNLQLTRGPTEAVASGTVPFSDNMTRLFDRADEITPEGIGIGSDKLLLLLGEPHFQNTGAARLLRKYGIYGETLKTFVEEELASPPPPPSAEEPAPLSAQLLQLAQAAQELATVGAGSNAGDSNEKEFSLAEVATDLTALAREGVLDPVIGREDETQRIIQILLRKRKNNACLVGPPGVGKTAVAEGLAHRIAAGQVPARLQGKTLLSLDLGRLVAGTKYRGAFEERLQKVIDEASNPEREIILFIDEIHLLVGAGVAGADSSMDAANLLKPALARGALQVIGATTGEEYTKYIEKDAALERRFQKVSCEEPSVDETIEILEGLRDSYQEHHGVLLDDDALTAAARLSDRFLTERFLPDKAVDLMDEACSMVQLRREARHVEASGHAARPVVTADDIAHVISNWSGVPVEAFAEDEASRVLGLEETLSRRLVGQSEAVGALSRAVRRARAGLAGSERPISSLFFAGPTGVGKTELCKVLAAEYFADPKALIQLDMSEYSEPNSASRLVGPPPGYVGFDDPRSGQLTEAVRRRPYCVVVLDEIEKAHPEVLSLLLQVLEEGRLSDSKGRVVSFANCIIIMTSNIGSQEILQLARTGSSYGNMRAAVQAQLQQKFRPEFLNRIDEVLVFKPLQTEDMRHIAKLALAEAARRASTAHAEASSKGKKGKTPLTLAWTADFEHLIVNQGATSNYGARPLRRAVQRFCEDPVASLLVAGAFAKGGTATLDVLKGNVVVQYGGQTLPSQVSAVLPEMVYQEVQMNLEPTKPSVALAAPHSEPETGMATVVLDVLRSSLNAVFSR